MTSQIWVTVKLSKKYQLKRHLKIDKWNEQPKYQHSYLWHSNLKFRLYAIPISFSEGEICFLIIAIYIWLMNLVETNLCSILWNLWTRVRTSDRPSKSPNILNIRWKKHFCLYFFMHMPALYWPVWKVWCIGGYMHNGSTKPVLTCQDRVHCPNDLGTCHVVDMSRTYDIPN